MVIPSTASLLEVRLRAETLSLTVWRSAESAIWTWVLYCYWIFVLVMNCSKWTPCLSIRWLKIVLGKKSTFSQRSRISRGFCGCIIRHASISLEFSRVERARVVISSPPGSELNLVAGKLAGQTQRCGEVELETSLRDTCPWALHHTPLWKLFTGTGGEWRHGRWMGYVHRLYCRYSFRELWPEGCLCLSWCQLPVMVQPQDLVNAGGEGSCKAEKEAFQGKLSQWSREIALGYRVAKSVAALMSMEAMIGIWSGL